MESKKNYNKRLFGYSLLMVGSSCIPDIHEYYCGFNINYTFGTAVVGILAGLLILLAYQD